MKQPTKETLLDSAYMSTVIRRNPAFNHSLALQEKNEGIPFTELDIDDRRLRIGRALASSAFKLADEQEKLHGEYSLEANLYQLVGKLGGFHEAELEMDSLNEDYDDPRLMPDDLREHYKRTRHTIIEFNHTLHEVINTVGSRLSFDELLAFMVNMHKDTYGAESAEAFLPQIRRQLSGVRSEMAVEQMMLAQESGDDYEYRLATADEDARGADLVINGVPIDIKASEKAASEGKARAHGYNPNLVVWSHLTPADFNGGLTLPFDKAKEAFARLNPTLMPP